MDDFAGFQKLAAWAGIALTVATVLNVVTLFASVDNDANTLFSDPTHLLLIGSTGANRSQLVPLEHGLRSVWLPFLCPRSRAGLQVVPGKGP
jgi:hypothetical protein